ncbi:MAG: hypothetical protein ACXWIS_10285 [Burkholderiales bacterium]
MAAGSGDANAKLSLKSASVVDPVNVTAGFAVNSIAKMTRGFATAELGTRMPCGAPFHRLNEAVVAALFPAKCTWLGEVGVMLMQPACADVV